MRFKSQNNNNNNRGNGIGKINGNLERKDVGLWMAFGLALIKVNNIQLKNREEQNELREREEQRERIKSF